MIDTLTISTELERLGFPKEQANAIAQIEAIKQDNLAVKQDNPAIKDDIARLEGKIDSIEQALGGRISSVEESLKGKIKRMEEKLDAAERVLGERINSVSRRVTRLYWFMGITGAVILSQLAISLKLAGILFP